ncbi:MAG TPA: outer membrane protein transport protein [Rhodocyclaceae bacterium]
MKTISQKLIPALVATVFASTASAAGFGLMEQSGSGLGNAFAGSAAVAENASTIYYNPAGMTQLKGKNFSGGVDYISLGAKFSDKGSTGAYANAQSQEGGDSAYVPNGYLSYQIDDKWFVGVGLSVPFGMRTNYPQSWKGNYTAMDTDIQSVNLNPSVAFKLNETVSLGFGVDYQFFKATYSGYAGTTAGVLKVQGNSTAWGWNGGALFNLSEATRIGISYRSKIKHNITGNYTTAVGGNSASLDIEVPDTWIISGFHKLNENWELLADVSRSGWSSIPQLKIMTPGFGTGSITKDYSWSDTTRFALGANYLATESLKWRVGIASDQSVVNDAHRTARLPDQDRVWYTFGVQYKPNKESAIDVAYAYIKAKKASIADTATGVPGTLIGEFDSNVQVLGAQYSLSF